MKYTQKTYGLMDKYENQGYTIVEGNNPLLHTRQKYYLVVRLATKTIRRHGNKTVSTVWAIKKG